MILNIHGYGSCGENSKYAWLAANVRGHEIVSPTIDYDREAPADVVAKLASMLDGSDAQSTYIVGSSLGGFFASCVHAKRPEITTILVNPALMPFVTMRKLDVPKFARKMFFDEFKKVYDVWSTCDRDDRLHVIWGDKDEVIAHGEITLPILPDEAKTYKIAGGAHGMPVDGAFADAMRSIIKDR